MFPTVSVLGIPLFDGNIPQAAEILLKSTWHAERHNHLISATGAHGLVTANRDGEFKKVLASFFMNLPDGMPSVWLGRLKGARQIKRCYGPEFFEAMIVASKELGFRHYFCGGKQGVAEELAQVCVRKFLNRNIVGVYSPPFRELTDAEMEVMARDINARGVDIVWIGLSTPKQEIFASRLSKHTRVHMLCTVGAAFDFFTGRLIEAPSWMQRLGLEWFFRLIVEPKRLWRRYAAVVPSFFIMSLLDLLRHIIELRHERHKR